MTKRGPTLPDRLRAARAHAGLSQGQVAKMMELHRPTISQIEAGDRRVTADELKQFARIYEVSLSWLVDDDASDSQDPRVLLAARDLAKLKKDDLDRVVELLSSLRGKGSKK